jgi:hypothetical protein
MYGLGNIALANGDTGLRTTIAFFRIQGAAINKEHAVTRIAGRILRRLKRTAPTA